MAGQPRARSGAWGARRPAAPRPFRPAGATAVPAGPRHVGNFGKIERAGFGPAGTCRDGAGRRPSEAAWPKSLTSSKASGWAWAFTRTKLSRAAGTGPVQGFGQQVLARAGFSGEQQTAASLWATAGRMRSRCSMGALRPTMAPGPAVRVRRPSSSFRAERSSTTSRVHSSAPSASCTGTLVRRTGTFLRWRLMRVPSRLSEQRAAQPSPWRGRAGHWCRQKLPRSTWRQGTPATSWLLKSGEPLQARCSETGCGARSPSTRPPRRQVAQDARQIGPFKPCRRQPGEWFLVFAHPPWCRPSGCILQVGGTAARPPNLEKGSSALRRPRCRTPPPAGRGSPQRPEPRRSFRPASGRPG